MPHLVTARELLIEDIAEGTPLLIPHGAGNMHVPGHVTAVHRTHDRTMPLRFTVKSDTGFETGGHWPLTGVRRYVTPDPEGDLELPVLDYIGSVTYWFSVFAPGKSPAECEAELAQLLEDNGYKLVGNLSAKPATEQQVIMRRGRGEDAAVKVCYEFETQAPCTTEFVDIEEPVSA